MLYIFGEDEVWIIYRVVCGQLSWKLGRGISLNIQLIVTFSSLQLDTYGWLIGIGFRVYPCFSSYFCTLYSWTIKYLGNVNNVFLVLSRKKIEMKMVIIRLVDQMERKVVQINLSRAADNVVGKSNTNSFLSPFFLKEVKIQFQSHAQIQSTSEKQRSVV